jgi:hypothetical protein
MTLLATPALTVERDPHSGFKRRADTHHSYLVTRTEDWDATALKA